MLFGATCPVPSISPSSTWPSSAGTRPPATRSTAPWPWRSGPRRGATGGSGTPSTTTCRDRLVGHERADRPRGRPHRTASASAPAGSCCPTTPRSPSPSSSAPSSRSTPAASTSAWAGPPAPTRSPCGPCAATPRSADTFPQDVQELQGYLRGETRVPGVRPSPGTGTNVPLYILGSSLFGATLAACSGLPYAFASHFAPRRARDAVATYRSEFRPSDQLDPPHVIAGVNVIAADTQDEAAAQHHVCGAAGSRCSSAGTGRFTDDEADALLAVAPGPTDRRHDALLGRRHARAVRTTSTTFAAHADADELIVVPTPPDPRGPAALGRPARRRERARARLTRRNIRGRSGYGFAMATGTAPTSLDSARPAHTTPGPGRARVGCSGWSYQDWRGVVYPGGRPAPTWFSLTAELFDTVEINNTFYRLPAASDGRGVGGAGAAGLLLRHEGRPVRHPPQEADATPISGWRTTSTGSAGSARTSVRTWSSCRPAGSATSSASTPS